MSTVWSMAPSYGGYSGNYGYGMGYGYGGVGMNPWGGYYDDMCYPHGMYEPDMFFGGGMYGSPYSRLGAGGYVSPYAGAYGRRYGNGMRRSMSMGAFPRSGVW